MGIEFRLGRNDHRVTEDLLSASPRRVDAIWVDAQNVARQAGVLEAAHEAGARALLELQLDRLEHPGFDFGVLPYVPAGGVDSLVLAGAAELRAVADAAVRFQVEAGTDLVAPHLFCADERHDEIVVEWAASTLRLAGDQPVRAIVAANRVRLARNDFAIARRLADELATAGVTEVELRLSPVGGRDMSANAVRSVFNIVDVFREHIADVVLGFQGLLGPAALALNSASAFSVGVGLREHFDFAALSRPQQPRGEDDHLYGPQAGVRLPGVNVTVSRAMANALYEDTAIRTRIRCRYGCCTGNVDGPVRDPRAHYLQSRTAEIAELLDRPLAWRARMEQQRVERAIELAEIINDGHIPPTAYPIKTRTMHALREVLSGEEEAVGAASIA